MFVRIFRCQLERVQQIVYEQDVPDLFAVAVYHYGVFQRGRYGEPCNPTLVLDAELAIAVYAGLAQHHRPEIVDPAVIPDILVSASFRASVRGVKIERHLLAHPVRQVLILVPVVMQPDGHVFHPAVHLVCGGENQHRVTQVLPHRFEHVERAQGVDLEILARVSNRCGNGHLRRHVHYDVRVVVLLEEPGYFVVVPDIAHNGFNGSLLLEPIEVLSCAFAR